MLLKALVSFFMIMSMRQARVLGTRFFHGLDVLPTSCKTSLELVKKK